MSSQSSNLSSENESQVLTKFSEPILPRPKLTTITEGELLDISGRDPCFPKLYTINKHPKVPQALHTFITLLDISMQVMLDFDKFVGGMTFLEGTEEGITHMGFPAALPGDYFLICSVLGDGDPMNDHLALWSLPGRSISYGTHKSWKSLREYVDGPHSECTPQKSACINGMWRLRRWGLGKGKERMGYRQPYIGRQRPMGEVVADKTTAVNEMAVNETAINETAVNETVINDMVVDETAINEMAADKMSTSSPPHLNLNPPGFMPQGANPAKHARDGKRAGTYDGACQTQSGGREVELALTVGEEHEAGGEAAVIAAATRARGGDDNVTTMVETGELATHVEVEAQRPVAWNEKPPWGSWANVYGHGHVLVSDPGGQDGEELLQRTSNGAEELLVAGFLMLELDSEAFVLLEWAAEVVPTVVLVTSTKEEAETDATALVVMLEMWRWTGVAEVEVRVKARTARTVLNAYVVAAWELVTDCQALLELKVVEADRRVGGWHILVLAAAPTQNDQLTVVLRVPHHALSARWHGDGLRVADFVHVDTGNAFCARRRGPGAEAKERMQDKT
ncbi:hypothetical protein L226DRAFT_527647 [Lentinus tigrinus ALCF2SS1-7]|uniref:uncharacterized protein n=1 Tax=Lentinus tigrinus ALCF2SS1-7 TaxID=1328758 RepID=UPI001165F9A8|nr:hypothetical protein L226DRAFT_527647 [Lentinus tigrinus ALCF2SS1-7]